MENTTLGIPALVQTEGEFKYHVSLRLSRLTRDLLRRNPRLPPWQCNHL
jgi:hypothetical protein